MSIKEPAHILAVVVHPEDECSTMEAALVQYQQQGVRIIMLCATRSEGKSRRDQELTKVASHLEIEIYFLEYHEGELSEVVSTRLIEQIGCWIDTVQPKKILAFGPDCCSEHPDHVILFHIIAQAVGQYFPEVPIEYMKSQNVSCL